MSVQQQRREEAVRYLVAGYENYGKAVKSHEAQTDESDVQSRVPTGHSRRAGIHHEASDRPGTLAGRRPAGPNRE